MEILNLKQDKDYTKIQNASRIIRDGGLVLFPTETVYGIGANGLNENAVKKIFASKGRASDNPLILHIADMSMLDIIAKDITSLEYKLMDAFWPGPFTIILKKTDIVPNVVTGGLNTVAVRMPANIIANRLIKYSNTPIAAPSANISGRPSGTCLEDIIDELGDKMDYIIDGGKCEVGIESTVVKVKDGQVKILRPGKITLNDIQKIISNVTLDKHIFEDLLPNEKVLSPGMKYKHYAPNTKSILVYSKDDIKMSNKINELSKEYNNVLVICSDENKKYYSNKTIFTYGSKYKLEEIARNIFTLLRKVDATNVDVVFIEGMEKEDLGIAIMNRLIRACSHEYIEIE